MFGEGEVHVLDLLDRGIVEAEAPRHVKEPPAEFDGVQGRALAVPRPVGVDDRVDVLRREQGGERIELLEREAGGHSGPDGRDKLTAAHVDRHLTACLQAPPGVGVPTRAEQAVEVAVHVD
jgi:hypothetical protein